jgi:hypothetical protein
MAYAEGTDVGPDRSRQELERILIRYGASAFGYGWEDGRAVVQFRASERFVKIELVMPDPADFASTPTGRARRSASAQASAHEQAVRQRWRALVLVVKAKLESVEAGIDTFDSAFLAHLVLPDGTTVGDRALPGVAEAYESGSMPRLLPERVG